MDPHSLPLIQKATRYLQKAADLDLGQFGAQALMDIGIQPLRVWTDLYLCGAQVRKTLFIQSDNGPRLHSPYATIMCATLRACPYADERHLAVAACRLAALNLFLLRETQHLANQP